MSINPDTVKEIAKGGNEFADKVVKTPWLLHLLISLGMTAASLFIAYVFYTNGRQDVKDAEARAQVKIDKLEARGGMYDTIYYKYMQAEERARYFQELYNECQRQQNLSMQRSTSSKGK